MLPFGDDASGVGTADYHESLQAGRGYCYRPVEETPFREVKEEKPSSISRIIKDI